MRKKHRIQVVIALLIGVAIVLLGGYWLGGRRVAVAERGNVGAEKVAPVVDADDQVGVDALKRRVADLERQLNAVLRGQARDLERKVADAEREGAALKSTVESAADEAEAAQERRAERDRHVLARLRVLPRTRRLQLHRLRAVLRLDDRRVRQTDLDQAARTRKCLRA